MSLMGCQVTISPVTENVETPLIMIGFSSQAFSQCVYVPYTNGLDVRVMAAEFAKAIVAAGEECAKVANKIPVITSLP